MLDGQCSKALPGPILFSNRDAAQMLKGALPHPQELLVVINVKIPFMVCKLGFHHNFITVMGHLQGRHNQLCVKEATCSGMRGREGATQPGHIPGLAPALLCDYHAQLLLQFLHLQMQVMILSKGIREGVGTVL